MYLISVLLLSMLFVELHFLNLALDLGIAFKYAICWIAFLKYAIYLTRKYYQRDKLTVFLKFCHIFSSQNQMYPKSCREMFRMEEIFIAKRGKFSLKDFECFAKQQVIQLYLGNPPSQPPRLLVPLGPWYFQRCIATSALSCFHFQTFYFIASRDQVIWLFQLIIIWFDRAELNEN